MTAATDHPLEAYRARFSPPKTRAEVARELGVHRATVARWETRERIPDQRFLVRLAEITGATIPELMGLEPKERSQ